MDRAPTTPATCRLCGGNAGTLNPDGAHNLCAARAAQGLPTPNLGTRCATCHGSGVKPGYKGGVMLSFDHGPAAIRRSIEAQFPPCPDCKGKGHT